MKRYSQIISLFNHCQGTEITLSNEQIAFHNTRGVTDVLSDSLKCRLDLLSSWSGLGISSWSQAQVKEEGWALG